MRSGTRHGASFKNITKQNKYGSSIRSHDLYQKRCVKDIYPHYGPWEFQQQHPTYSWAFYTLKRPTQHSPHFQLLQEDLKNKENNEEIIKKRLQNLAGNFVLTTELKT